MKRWPLQEAYFWERAPFFRLLFPLIAGIVLYGYTSAGNHIASLALLGVSSVLFLVTSFLKSQSRLFKYLRFGSLHLALIAASWLLCYFNDTRNDDRWFASKKSDAYVARIQKLPEEKDKTWKLEVDVIKTIEGEVTTGKALVYVYKNKIPLVFGQGDIIMLPDKWQEIKTSGNPFEFDYAAYCNRNNIYYQQFLSGDDIVLHHKALPDDISLVQRLHNYTLSQLDAYIHDDKVLGLMQAMLIGDEANLDSDLRQAYSETGIIHIVAISGSHITIFFLVITFLLGWIKHRKWNWIKYIAAIPLIWLYVIMSGAPPSAVRAALMFSILGIGFALDKQSHSLNHLFATAFILLCAEPMWLYAIGFQLSFIAVLSLVLFYRPIYKIYVPVNKVLRLLWSVVVASIAAEILVAPLVIYYFHLFPLLFIVANVAAYVFMGLALIGGMLLVVLSAFKPIATFIAVCIEYPVKWFNELVYIMQDNNPVSFGYLYIDMKELLCLYLLIAGAAIYLLKQKKSGMYVSLTATIVLLVMLNVNEWDALHQQRLIVYNINKVNHIELIQGKKHIVLHTDTMVDAQKKNYVLKPVHTAYNAWIPGEHYYSQVLNISGKKVLILNKPLIQQADVFPVDYVIINYNAGVSDMHKIQQVFKPQQIVLGSSVPRYLVDDWIAAALEGKTSLWTVSGMGAFIL